MHAATTARRHSSMDSRTVGELISDIGEWMDFLNSLESLLSAAEAQTSSTSMEPSLVSQAQELVRRKRKLLRNRLLEGSQSTTSAVADSATESSFDLEPLEIGSTKSVFTTNIDVDVLGSFDATQIIKANRDSGSSQGFVDAFRQIALQINPPLDPNNPTPKPPKSVEASEGPITRPLANNLIVLQEMRMHCFNRSYPIWRKLFTHNTQSRKLLRSRPKDLRRMTSAISPKISHFALCSSSQYFIYRIPTDFNDPPELIFSGPIKSESDETHYFVSMNERWVAFASVEGHIFVVSLATGKIIYKDDIDFNIQALDVSLKGSFVVYTILSTNKTTLQKQPMICILCPNVAGEDDDAFLHVDTVTFTSPYSDMIKTIKVSPDETYLVCGTDEESRLFGVSLLDPRQPRILFRSSRKVSDDPEYEGITDIEFLDDSRSLIVSSVSQGCPPVVFDTKIIHGQRRGSSSSNATTNLPTVVMRIDKFGSKIHRAVPSPIWRGAAFVDKSGAVYILASSRLATEHRKFTVCFEVAASNTKFKAASIQWSPDGTVLVAVDRKGVFQAADFGAGPPGSSGMSKVRTLS